MQPENCPKCGQPMNYGKDRRCRACVLEARRASYRRGREPGNSQPARDLVASARRGDLPVVEGLLDTSTPALRRRALIAAAKHGHSEVVELLLTRLHDPAVVAGALHAAAFYYHGAPKTAGHGAVVHALLRRVEAPEARVALAGSKLCLAAEAGAGVVVRALLEAGARLDLFSAAALGRTEEVRALLTNQPDLARTADSQGMTALHRCAASALGRDCSETAARLYATAELLIDAGADVCAADTRNPEAPWRMSPLTLAAWHGGNTAIARLLLDRGATCSEDFQQSLWFALGHHQRHGDGHYDIGEILVRHGADVNAGDGRTLLHALAHHGDARGVAWLLRYGAEVHARDEEGRTPLHLAAERNDSPRLVTLLLDAGADPHARDTASRTPLQLAERNAKRRVAQLLRERGAVE